MNQSYLLLRIFLGKTNFSDVFLEAIFHQFNDGYLLFYKPKNIKVIFNLFL
jgi:hypothetical protein